MFLFRKVYAVEIDAKRFKTLFGQIQKTHSFCVEPLNQDALTLDPKQYSHVEYILVDPTCSGSGKEFFNKIILKLIVKKWLTNNKEIGKNGR